MAAIVSSPSRGAAAAPSPQEIQRKLSTSRPNKPPPPVAPLSGAESDSDSVFSPDAPTSAVSLSLSSGAFFSPTTAAPLTAIVERRTASGEETDEDDEEEEGWRAATAGQKAVNSAAQGVQPEVRKAGYLWKKGIRRKTWKKRWFVLRLPHLAYYKSSAEYKLLRLLDLHEVHAVATCSLKRHEHTFGIVSPNRTFYLQAESEAEMLDWVQALNDIRVALQSTASVNDVPPTPQPAAQPIAIPPPSTPRRRSGSESHSPLTPSPPARLHIQNVTSSDSDEPSPTVPQSATLARAAGGVLVPSGTQDPSKPVLSGYLMKCSQKRRNWRKRWFTLTGEKLVYTASHMDTRPHRVIQLTQIVDALEVDVPFPGAKHVPHPPPVASPPSGPGGDDDGAAHTFKVITPKRTLLLCAPSEEEEIKWLSAIRALIARRSGGPADGTVRRSGRRLSGAGTGAGAAEGVREL